MAILALLGASVQPVAAQSVLRDAETEALLHDMASPLITAAGLDPKNVNIVLVDDPQVNAFVAGGQAVYVNSGLINEADNVNQLQGVVAHELGHVVGGHAIDSRGAEAATSISILSLLLAGAAMAAGGGEAAMGVLMAGQQAAMGKYIAYTRGQEEQADAAGAKFLAAAGISGRGSVDFFHKLLNMENRYGVTRTDDDAFYTDHPLTDDRIAFLQDTYEKDPAWNKPVDPALDARFQRIKAKLFGYLATPADTMQTYPDYMTGVPARYARAYAFHKDGYLDKAMEEANALLATAPDLDYLVLLIPSTPETRGIVSREVLRAMKPTAFLVNVARGAVVEEPALIEALQQGWIGGAGLDTFVHEPLPPDSPFWDCPNTIVTPHLAGMYQEYPYAAAAQFNHNYALFKAGRYAEMTHIEPRGT